MILHDIFGKHQPDPSDNRWDSGLFVSKCLICGRAMVKPTGAIWQLDRARW
jgi:hypothetical protein